MYLCYVLTNHVWYRCELVAPVTPSEAGDMDIDLSHDETVFKVLLLEFGSAEYISLSMWVFPSHFTNTFIKPHWKGLKIKK